MTYVAEYGSGNYLGKTLLTRLYPKIMKYGIQPLSFATFIAVQQEYGRIRPASATLYWSIHYLVEQLSKLDLLSKAY